MTLSSSYLNIDSGVVPLNIEKLLANDAGYLIPMYQRNYAWRKTEIETLIKDIIDAYKLNPTQNYYLGTLVVFEKSNNIFEVIDGQQRLTTLMLLAIYLNKNESIYCQDYLEEFKPNLDFESRPKSKRTLSLLFNINDNAELIDIDQRYSTSLSIMNGYDILSKAMNHLFKTDSSQIPIEKFCSFLFEKVQIARVPVPQETDLNHYFEVMNNRGEQLEKHEIIKARLLSELTRDTEANNTLDLKNNQHSRQLLNLIWSVCSNTNKYVQYGFASTLRAKIFSDDWTQFNAENFDELLELYVQYLEKKAETNKSDKKQSTSPIIGDTHETEYSLNSILFDDNVIIPSNPAKKNTGEQDEETYYSIVDFPNFLMHSLKIYVAQGQHIDAVHNNDVIENTVSLDDKQLLTEFNNHLINASVDDKVNKIKGFLYTLLKTRFLFDRHIIKRNTEAKKGYWTLEYLKNQDSGASYVQDMDSDLNSELVTLQTAFHVSAPTMNKKYWLSASLQYLYFVTDKAYKNSVINHVDSEAYTVYLKGLAKAYILKNYIAPSKSELRIISNDYFNSFRYTGNSLNDDTNHEYELKSLLSQLNYHQVKSFAFNYLDYLIWLNDKSINKDIKDRFRPSTQGSIEHFLPQNPIKPSEEIANSEIDVHRFGNLCLINRGLNSRVSNHLPLAKKEYYDKEFKDRVASLKLYKMIELLASDGEWSDVQIVKHEINMLKLLKKGLNIRIIGLENNA